jgi:hypothetical protein
MNLAGAPMDPRKDTSQSVLAKFEPHVSWRVTAWRSAD